jgi:hypothetical protein
VTIRTITLVADNQNISAAVHAALDASVAGDKLFIERAGFTGAKIITPGAWTRIVPAIEIGVLNGGVRDLGVLIANPLGDGLTYERYRTRHVEWQGFLRWAAGAGQVADCFGFLRTYDNAAIFPHDYKTTGRTFTSQGYNDAGLGRGLDRIEDQAGAFRFKNTYFGGIDENRGQVVDGFNYKWFAKTGGAAADNYNAGAGGYFNAIYDSPCGIQGVAAEFDIQDCVFDTLSFGARIAARKDCRVERNTFRYIYGIGVQANQIAGSALAKDRTCFINCNLFIGFHSNADDFTNPHSDGVFVGYETGVVVNNQVFANNIAINRTGDRGQFYLIRFQAQTGTGATNVAARGAIIFGNIGINTYGMELSGAAGGVIMRNLMVVQPGLAFPFALQANGLSISNAAWFSAFPTAVGLITENVHEGITKAGNYLDVANRQLATRDATAQQALFVDPLGEAVTPAAAYAKFRPNAGVTGLGPPAATLHDYLETLDLSLLPPHLAFPTFGGATAGSGAKVQSGKAICYLGGVLTPSAGLEAQVYGLDGTTVLTAWSAAPVTVPARGFAELRALPSALVGATKPNPYTIGSSTYSWLIANATSNRVPGVVIGTDHEQRIAGGIKKRDVANVLQAIGTSQTVSWFMTFKIRSGAATRLALLHSNPAGDRDFFNARQLIEINNGGRLDFHVNKVNRSSGNEFVSTDIYDAGGSAFAQNVLHTLMVSIDFSKGSWAAGVNVHHSVGGGSSQLVGSFDTTWKVGAAPHVFTWSDIFTFFRMTSIAGAFDGEVYYAGMTDELVDWATVKGLIDITNPDQIGPRFQGLSPTGKPWPLPMVGDATRWNAGLASLNPDNPLVKGGTNATAVAIANTCLPGQNLGMVASLLTPVPRAGSPVQVLIQYSGLTVAGNITPGVAGLAVSGLTAKAVQEASNGDVITFTPTVSGDGIFTTTNDMGHTNIIPLAFTVLPRTPIATVNFTARPALGAPGAAFPIAIPIYDAA